MRTLVLAVVAVSGLIARANAAPVTVFLDAGGHVEEVDGDRIEVPAFGGGKRVWNAVVSCVQAKYKPFAVDVVDARPSHGAFITAVVGGGAELLGLDPEHVAGIGPSDGGVIADAVVHVFSQTIGEKDVQELCETSAHEIGHALGLDHSMQCGDLMSYPREECGRRPTLTFLDADARCGEFDDRDCQSGASMQNSFEKLAELVGLRDAEPEQPQDMEDPEDPDESQEPVQTGSCSHVLVVRFRASSRSMVTVEGLGRPRGRALRNGVRGRRRGRDRAWRGARQGG